MGVAWWLDHIRLSNDVANSSNWKRQVGAFQATTERLETINESLQKQLGGPSTPNAKVSPQPPQP
jgi:hypothetical protein